MRRAPPSPSSSWGYTPKDNWVVCDICGLRFRASEVRTQPWGLWKGMLVCANDVDDYNPQHEDLRAVTEKIVPDKVNIEPDSETLTFTGDLHLPFTLDETAVLGDGSGSSKITADDL